MKSYSDTETDHMDPDEFESFQKRNDRKNYRWYQQQGKNRQWAIYFLAFLLLTLHFLFNFVVGFDALFNPKFYCRSLAILLIFCEWKLFKSFVMWCDNKNYQWDMEAAAKKFTPEQVKRLKHNIKHGLIN